MSVPVGPESSSPASSAIGIWRAFSPEGMGMRKGRSGKGLGEGAEPGTRLRRVERGGGKGVYSDHCCLFKPTRL